MKEKYKEILNKPAWHIEDGYNEHEKIRFAIACKFIRQYVSSSKIVNIFDVGCGIGPLREWLVRDTYNIVGLEISEDAAEQAKVNYNDCLVGDVEEAWNVPAMSLDVVHAGAVLEHVIDWHAPLNHANKALKGDGILVISVPNIRNWSTIRSLLRGKQPHWLKDMKHLHGYTPNHMINLLECHGFELLDIEADNVRFPFLPRQLGWIRRKFPKWGNVVIIAARLKQRLRIEDKAMSSRFQEVIDVSDRYIRVING